MNNDKLDLVELWIVNVCIPNEGLIRFPTEAELDIFRNTRHLRGYLIHDSVDFYEILRALNRTVCQLTIDFTNYSLHYPEKLIISNIKFRNDFRGWESLSDIEVSFLDCIFMNPFSLENVSFKNLKFNTVKFHDCLTMRGVAVLKKSEEDTKDPSPEILFKDVEFEGDVDFNGVLGKVFNISDSNFHKSARFQFVQMKEGSAEIRNVKFSKEAKFQCCQFKHELRMSDLLTTDDTHISFDHTRESEYISITNSLIDGRLTFNHDMIKFISLKESTINGSFSIITNSWGQYYKILDNDWETANILKHEALKRNNMIKALEYKALEKDRYTCKLWNHKPKTMQVWAEIFSLWMSKATNNHGQNWVQALFVTILFYWILPFTIFYLLTIETPRSLDSFLSVLSSPHYLADLVVYLIPYDFDLLIEYLKNNPTTFVTKTFGVLIYVLGKILMAFGIFEIVQAFRKFNKV